MQENRLAIANADLQKAQAELDEKQAELDVVQGEYEKAVMEKQVAACCSGDHQRRSAAFSLTQPGNRQIIHSKRNGSQI